MLGAICKRDVLAHPFVTIHCFGWRIFFQTLVASRDQTFLSLVATASLPRPPTVQVPALVDRCIALEHRSMRLYESLAERFAHEVSARQFFLDLAGQEKEHAELLQLCRAAAERGRWERHYFEPWRDAIPRLEKHLQDAGASLGSISSLSDALRLVIEIESSEINQIFQGVVAASGSEFIRRLQVFQTATTSHISFICERIPMLVPDLAQACRATQNGFLEHPAASRKM